MQSQDSRKNYIDRDNVSPLARVNLQQLQAEITRIDILIQREVHRWQLAGQDPNDGFRGRYVSDLQANGLLARPLFTSWGQMVNLTAEEEETWRNQLRIAEEGVRLLTEAAHAQGHLTCLESLAAAFQLDRFDLDALLVCLAPCLDLRYERLYGYLQDDLARKRPGINLILDLLCSPGAEKMLSLAHFSSAAPLIRHHLLEFPPDQSPGWLPLISCSLAVSETIFAWLLGDYQPGPCLAGRIKLLVPSDIPVDQPCVENWLNERPPSLSASEGPVCVFYGPDEAAQDAAARSLAVHAGLPLLVVDLNGLAEADELSALAVVQIALRDARMVGALPYFYGWDALLVDGKTPPVMLREVYDFPGGVIIGGRETWQAAGLERQRRIFWQAFPIPAYPQRRLLWTHFLGADFTPDGKTLDTLAGQFALTSGQIRDASASLKDTEESFKNPEGTTLTSAAVQSVSRLFAAARAHSNPGLARLAHKLSPRYCWDDIILPADALAQLKEIVAAVRGRTRVLDDWGLGHKLVSSRGVTVLFSGQPGTGKTMAAEIIAGELSLDLYKIDLSTVVSKYVGETEKNMERIFSEAETSNAILFFDEADALFGKRSEVRDSHDRYANIEISYLLQRMEAYNGVTILATNLRANLDEAFTRRLQYAVDFPFPGEADRLRIWQILFPPGVPLAQDLDIPLLARRFKLAGGNIRNILVSAAYLAASDGQYVTMDHLLHCARRELQKMGKLIYQDPFEQTNNDK